MGTRCSVQERMLLKLTICTLSCTNPPDTPPHLALHPVVGGGVPVVLDVGAELLRQTKLLLWKHERFLTNYNHNQNHILVF